MVLLCQYQYSSTVVDLKRRPYILVVLGQVYDLFRAIFSTPINADFCSHRIRGFILILLIVDFKFCTINLNTLRKLGLNVLYTGNIKSKVIVLNFLFLCLYIIVIIRLNFYFYKCFCFYVLRFKIL